MAANTVKLGGKKFVIVPKREFDRIQAQAKRQVDQEQQDAGDVAEFQAAIERSIIRH